MPWCTDQTDRLIAVEVKVSLDTLYLGRSQRLVELGDVTEVCKVGPEHRIEFLVLDNELRFGEEVTVSGVVEVSV